MNYTKLNLLLDIKKIYNNKISKTNELKLTMNLQNLTISMILSSIISLSLLKNVSYFCNAKGDPNKTQTKNFLISKICLNFSGFISVGLNSSKNFNQFLDP